MHTRPGDHLYFKGGCIFVASLIGFLGILHGDWWWALVIGAGGLLMGCLWHIWLAWWRDSYELFHPDTPDPDTTRYQLFMDRWAIRLARSIGIRWQRPGDTE